MRPSDDTPWLTNAVSAVAQLIEEQGIEDFQLHYAIETLRRTTKSSVALRK